MNSFNTKLVGVSFEGRQGIVKGLFEGELLSLIRELDNPYDANAVMALRSDGKQVGYVSRDIASELAPALDKGLKYTCTVTNITGIDKDTKGVNVEITRLNNDIIIVDETSNIPTNKLFCLKCGRNYPTNKEAESCCKI